jgi:Tfp pilus assembly protein PilN
MLYSATRLGVLVLGDRLVVAALGRKAVDTFEVQSDNPSAALRAELDARGITARTAAIGLSRASVSVKPVELPAVEGDVRDVLRYEIERHLPFPADDAPFDFAPFPAPPRPDRPEGTRMVLVAAADRHFVDSVVRFIQEAKLRPTSVTVAAHDLVDLAAVNRDQHVVWLHRADDALDLVFVGSGRVVLSRRVGALDDAGLADEIRRSLAVARWRTCDAVWVSGDGAEAESPGKALAWLGAQVTTPPYTARGRRLLADLPAERRGVTELAVAVAAGRRVRALDLIPAALKPRRITRAQAITAGTAAAALLLGLGALMAPGYRENRRLAAINAEIARLDPEVRGVEKVARELERRQKLLSMLDSLETGAIRPLPVLRELTDVVPNDAWLTMLSLDPKGVELTGQASAASSLIPLLENSPRFERVEFSSPVTRGRDREQFRIRAAWEGNGASAVTLTPAAAVPTAAPVPPPPAPAIEGPEQPRPAARPEQNPASSAPPQNLRRPATPGPGQPRS